MNEKNGMTEPLTLTDLYWQNLEFDESDLDFLYSYLLEIETPQNSQELLQALVTHRIKNEIDSMKNQQQNGGKNYLPKKKYEVGQTVIFPLLSRQKGEIVNVREGNNPDTAPFKVIEVAFESGEHREFAADLENHDLNRPAVIDLDDPNLKSDVVIKKFGSQIIRELNQNLEQNSDLVRIAGRWFPRALLVDVNIGYLNLAEALLDMENGGPLSTRKILEQIELPTDTNIKLTEFSLNLALQEDGRFDEVGPAGEVLWFLRRLEPENVREQPIFLRYHDSAYDHDAVRQFVNDFSEQVIDELEPVHDSRPDATEATVALLYPHWRAGTLPLDAALCSIFPTALESPRVQFTFVDGNDNSRFSGWVVRPHDYVYGLREWYDNTGVFPGSLIQVKKSSKPGEIIVKAEKKRSTRDWIRTALVGTDGGLVFAMLKQQITTAYDERMAIFVPDSTLLDNIWTQGGRRQPLEKIAHTMMIELAKLTPQGHVHAQELYAAVNLVRRCPPGLILHHLTTQPWANHLGDLYFRLQSPEEDSGNE
jgi:hypothetical protein